MKTVGVGTPGVEHGAGPGVPGVGEGVPGVGVGEGVAVIVGVGDGDGVGVGEGVGEGVGVGGEITGDAPQASFTATVASFVTSGEYAAPLASRCALFVSVSA
jgi:hypothetical protein